MQTEIQRLSAELAQCIDDDCYFMDIFVAVRNRHIIADINLRHGNSYYDTTLIKMWQEFASCIPTNNYSCAAARLLQHIISIKLN